MRALSLLGLVGCLALVVPACGDPVTESPTAGMTLVQRGKSIEAVFALAWARVHVDRAAKEEALGAYRTALGLLPRGEGLERVEAFAQEVERERAAYAARAEAPPAPVAAADALVQYDVRDLVVALERLDFPPLVFVGSDGTHRQSLEASLAARITGLLTGPDGSSKQRPLDALDGVLVLRGAAVLHAAMNIYLSTLRASWPALWPGILPAAAPGTAPK